MARLRTELSSNRMKDEFLATVTHELHAPLTAILGWTRLLRSNQLDSATALRALDIIERNAKNQAKLIEELLDISTILSGKVCLDNHRLNLTNIIKEEISKISSDADRLKQIVLNLLTNAIKFTPEGGRIEVHVCVIGNQAQIEISDTGIGIEPEFLPYVFETFCQSINSKTGLGIGLAIARQLVHLHGGTLTAESSGIGQGATFTIKLALISANV